MSLASDVQTPRRDVAVGDHDREEAVLRLASRAASRTYSTPDDRLVVGEGDAGAPALLAASARRAPGRRSAGARSPSSALGRRDLPVLAVTAAHGAAHAAEREHAAAGAVVEDRLLLDGVGREPRTPGRRSARRACRRDSRVRRTSRACPRRSGIGAGTSPQRTAIAFVAATASPHAWGSAPYPAASPTGCGRSPWRGTERVRRLEQPLEHPGPARPTDATPMLAVTIGDVGCSSAAKVTELAATAPAQLLGDGERLGLIRTRQDDRELVAAVARGDVALAELGVSSSARRARRTRRRPPRGPCVSLSVLEAVEVDHEQRERGAVAVVPRDLFGKALPRTHGGSTVP